jgi:mevalonate kinase
MQEFFAHGKLMLSGEYSVLQGAKAVAVPCKMGQHLKVSRIDSTDLKYRALDHQGKVWLDFNLSQASSAEEKLLAEILNSHAQADQLRGWQLETRLDFPREWGLGSSSSFISLIAKWLKQDVWPLFFTHLSGSGYDVAVAESGRPIIYQLLKPQQPSWEACELPKFFEQTYFLYLGQKQNSAQEVARFLKSERPQDLVQELSSLSEALLNLSGISDLEDWMQEHEKLTSELIGRKPVPASLLPEFGGLAKSLGAWGGDFLWLSKVDDFQALKSAGYHTLVPYSEMVAFNHL